jgi:hypothetical protein
MLIKPILFTCLLLTTSSLSVAQSEPKELANLPIAEPSQGTSQFVSLVQPLPPTPPLPQEQALKRPATPKDLLRAKLESTMRQGNTHIVKVKLVSHRVKEGRLLAANSDSFTLQTAFDPRLMIIRFDEVVGEPKIRLGSNVIVGRIVAGIGVALMIPAAPFLLLGFGISGDLSD